MIIEAIVRSLLKLWEKASLPNVKCRFVLIACLLYQHWGSEVLTLSLLRVRWNRKIRRIPEAVDEKNFSLSGIPASANTCIAQQASLQLELSPVKGVEKKKKVLKFLTWESTWLGSFLRISDISLGLTSQCERLTWALFLIMLELEWSAAELPSSAYP